MVESVGQVALATLATKDLRPSTRRTYLKYLKRFWHMEFEALNVSDLQEVLHTMPNQNTRRACIIALKSSLDHPAVKALKVPSPVAKVYDLPDEDWLKLALMGTMHATRGYLMAYGGLRLGEASAITRADMDGRWLVINKQVDEVTLRIVPVKAGSARVPLPTWLVPLVAELDGTVNPKALRVSIQRAGKRAGIKLTPHMLRHWYATSLVKKGVPPAVVQQLCRHKDIRLTLTVYTQVATSDLTDAIDNL